MLSELFLIIGFIFLVTWVIFFVFTPSFIGNFVDVETFIIYAFPFLGLFLILIGLVNLKTEKRLSWVEYFFKPDKKKIFLFFLLSFLIGFYGQAGLFVPKYDNILEKALHGFVWFFLYVPIMNFLLFIMLAFSTYFTSCLITYIYDKLKRKPN